MGSVSWYESKMPCNDPHDDDLVTRVIRSWLTMHTKLVPLFCVVHIKATARNKITLLAVTSPIDFWWFSMDEQGPLEEDAMNFMLE